MSPRLRDNSLGCFTQLGRAPTLSFRTYGELLLLARGRGHVLADLDLGRDHRPVRDGYDSVLCRPKGHG